MIRAGLLILLIQEQIFEHPTIEARSHQALVGLPRRLDDRFPTHVETGVQKKRAARVFLKLFEQSIESRAVGWIHGLDAGRSVDVGHGRNPGSLLGPDGCNQQHIGAGMVQLEIGG